MPYYMRGIAARRCGVAGCSRMATVTVYRPDNEAVGDFCTPHGEQRTVQMNAGLDEEVAQGRWSR